MKLKIDNLLIISGFIILFIILFSEIIKNKKWYNEKQTNEIVSFEVGSIEQQTCSGKQIGLYNNCKSINRENSFICFLDENNIQICLSGGITNIYSDPNWKPLEKKKGK